MKKITNCQCSCVIKNTCPDYKGRHDGLDDRPSVNVKLASEKGIFL